VQFAILLLLVVALGFLILGLVGSSTPLVIASMVTSAIAGYLIVRSRRRLAAAPSARPRAATKTVAQLAAEAAKAELAAAVLPAVAATASAADSSPADAVPATSDRHDPPDADPPPASTEAPLRQHGSDDVWVLDGRPRYHLAACRFLLAGGAGEAIPLKQAVADGFTPCSQCDPDAALAAADVAQR
jgi:hypothetical protein